jgi:hypothetical protein
MRELAGYGAAAVGIVPDLEALIEFFNAECAAGGFPEGPLNDARIDAVKAAIAKAATVKAVTVKAVTVKAVIAGAGVVAVKAAGQKVAIRSRPRPIPHALGWMSPAIATWSRCLSRWQPLSCWGKPSRLKA